MPHNHELVKEGVHVFTPDTCEECKTIGDQQTEMRAHADRLVAEIKEVAKVFQGIRFDDKNGTKITFTRRQLDEMLSRIITDAQNDIKLKGEDPRSNIVCAEPTLNWKECNALIAFWKHTFQLQLECTGDFQSARHQWHTVVYDLHTMQPVFGMINYVGDAPLQKMFCDALYIAYCVKCYRASLLAEAMAEKQEAAAS